MADMNDRISRQILFCLRHINTPDIHSFTVCVPGGIAYVEAEDRNTVYVDVNTGNCEHRLYSGTPEGAAEFLESMGADPNTIEN